MKYRKFGNTDLLVSEVGFGAWAIGGGAMIGDTAIGWGDANDKTSIEAIDAAVEAGINFFDTADIYGLGHSEALLGKALSKNKDVLIASKAGNLARDGKFTVEYSKEYILKACHASLQRLKRDTIDYYQLHTAKLVHLQKGECIEAMQQLQKEGKIRYWGLSLNTFYPSPEAEFLLQHNVGSGFQIVLNLLNQRGLPVIKEAAKKGYGIIARMPLQFGLLTGKFDDGVQFPENDHRKNRLTPALIASTANATKQVWALCEKYDCNKTTLALSYILSYPEVSTVIPGIRTKDHVDGNTKGIVQLDAGDLSFIEELYSSALATIVEEIESLG